MNWVSTTKLSKHWHQLDLRSQRSVGNYLRLRISTFFFFFATLWHRGQWMDLERVTGPAPGTKGPNWYFLTRGWNGRVSRARSNSLPVATDRRYPIHGPLEPLPLVERVVVAAPCATLEVRPLRLLEMNDTRHQKIYIHLVRPTRSREPAACTTYESSGESCNTRRIIRYRRVTSGIEPRDRWWPLTTDSEADKLPILIAAQSW
jgi:hypothetical protein